jgi:hypothetical protein
MSSIATAAYDQSITSAFPSIVIGPDRAIEPQGSFAEAQAQVSCQHFASLLIVNALMI